MYYILVLVIQIIGRNVFQLVQSFFIMWQDALPLQSGDVGFKPQKCALNPSIQQKLNVLGIPSVSRVLQRENSFKRLN